MNEAYDTNLLLLRVICGVIPMLLTAPAVRRADVAFEKHLRAIRHSTDMRTLQVAQADYLRANRHSNRSVLRAVVAILLAQTIITFTLEP